MGEPERNVPPDERVFRAHVAGARFQSVVDRGEWCLLGIEWPHALIAVSAAERQNGPLEFVLRFELSGYPTCGMHLFEHGAEQDKRDARTDRSHHGTKKESRFR